MLSLSSSLNLDAMKKPTTPINTVKMVFQMTVASMSARQFLIYTNAPHKLPGFAHRLYFGLRGSLECLVLCFVGNARMQKSVLLRRQNAKICVVVVSMISIKMINLRTFKKLAYKCLSNQTMYEKRLAAYVPRRSITQSNLYIRQSTSVSSTFFLL
jgi:hypothetical protein